jgi:hypothetical protein
MEGTTSLNEAKEIMGLNMIGPDDFKKINDKYLFLNLDLISQKKVSSIPFRKELLIKKKETHLLTLIIPEHFTKKDLNFKDFRDYFGFDPELKQPCFYNQDWYLNEPFYINSKLELKWVLVQKEISKSTRGKDPDKLNDSIGKMQNSLTYTYIFFIYFLSRDKILWEHDYVWCADFDSNKDQIYIGRYLDPMKINKNGFSIHRHLKIKNNYGLSNIIQ